MGREAWEQSVTVTYNTDNSAIFRDIVSASRRGEEEGSAEEQADPSDQAKAQGPRTLGSSSHGGYVRCEKR